MGRVPQDVLVEAVAAAAAVRRGDDGGAVAALLEGDVAVRGAIVGGGELEFDPGGGEEGGALDAAFERGGEGDEGGGVGGHGGGFFRVGEVGAGGAVAVPGWDARGVRTLGERGGEGKERYVCTGWVGLPEVVVEVVGAGFVGFVGEDDAGPAVVGLAGGVLDEALLRWAVGHLLRVAWCRVAVGVGDQDVLVALRRRALVVTSARRRGKRDCQSINQPVDYRCRHQDYRPKHRRRYTSCRPRTTGQTSPAAGNP